MKSYKNLIVFFLGITSFSFLLSKKNITPPGTVLISNSFYVDETEVTNQLWEDYVNWNKNEFGVESNEYKKSLPDTLVWRNKLFYGQPYVEYYLRHPSFRDYPVVGISYDQVIEYCKWRTDRVNESILIKKKMKIKKIDGFYEKIELGQITVPKFVEYRLPTIEEWEDIARIPYINKAYDDTNYICNMIDTSSQLHFNSGDIPTVSTYNYYSNLKGVYCMYGNVSEMVQEKGIAKGGSWRDTLTNNNFKKILETDYKYLGPSNRTGFRCVAVKLIDY